jgi:hypothetical protein
MRLSFLKHLLDSVSALCAPERIVIMGSSSLLPLAPQLGGPGQPLEVSLDADFLIEPMDQMTADMLDEAIGNESLFEKRNGYHADILRPAIGEALPKGWETRLHPVADYKNVFALDVYDLALVKLMVGREKDLTLLRALFRLGIIELSRLREHYHKCPLGEREALAAGRNLAALLKEIGSG